MADAPLLRFSRVSKRFGGTLAVDDVSLDLHAGEILALLGENGAGKSTLIKMLAGIHPPDEGQILVHGQHYQHRPARAGERQPIAFIHQDLGLIDWMTVAENMAIGQGFPRRFGLIDWRQAERRARDALDAVGGAIDPDARVGGLTRTEKSLVAIARALGRRGARCWCSTSRPRACRPTRWRGSWPCCAACAARDVGMIYVSHRLDEVFEIADGVAVLRDGRLVGRKPVAETTPRELVTMIVGRPPEQVFVRAETAARAVALELRELQDRRRRAGLLRRCARARCWAWSACAAPGRSRSAARCSGWPRSMPAAVMPVRRHARSRTSGAAMRAGIGLVAGDRTGESLAMPLERAREHVPQSRRHGGAPSTGGGRAPNCAMRECCAAGSACGPTIRRRPVETLSGGNQQKVVIARWLGSPRSC